MKYQNRRNCLNSEKGSMLIQVMIAAAMSFVIILAIAQMTVLMSRMAATSQLKLSLFEIRNDLLSVLLTDAAWINTINHADNTADPFAPCLSGTNGDAGPPLDCSNRKGVLTVIDGSAPPVMILSKSATSAGYSVHGQACNTFDAVTPDPQCPIRVSTEWETECSAPCSMRAPPIKVNVIFQYSQSENTTQINTSNLNFTLRR